MQVWNVLHAARWKYRSQKSPKNCHLRTIAQLCPAAYSQLRHVSTIGKKLLSSNIASTCPHNMANCGPISNNGWDRFGSLRNPSKFQRVWRLAFVTAATSLTGGQPNLSPALVHYITYTFSRAVALWRNFATSKIYIRSKCCVLQYWQRYCTALQQRASAKLCGVVQGMEVRNFRKGCHHIFGWAADTLGIGPHSSYGRPMDYGRPLYFCPVVSVYLSIFLFFSPILSRRRLDVYHTSTHDVALMRI